MTPLEKARVQECVQELSEILYRNTSFLQMPNLGGIHNKKEHLDFPDSPIAINEVCLRKRSFPVVR